MQNLKSKTKNYNQKLKNSPLEGGHQSFGLRILHFGHSRQGFTMVEIVVMMSIVTIVSAVVLVSFTGLHEGAAINRSAREMALSIRRAQNMSLAVTQIDTNAGPRIPPAVGVRFDTGSSRYFLFADLTPDNSYRPDIVEENGDAKLVGGETAMEGGVSVRSLTVYDTFGTPRAIAVAHVLFLAPEASAVISDASGASLGDTIRIELSSASGNTRSYVTVRTSGQVSIERFVSPSNLIQQNSPQ